MFMGGGGDRRASELTPFCHPRLTIAPESGPGLEQPASKCCKVYRDVNAIIACYRQEYQPRRCRGSWWSKNSRSRNHWAEFRQNWGEIPRKFDKFVIRLTSYGAVPRAESAPASWARPLRVFCTLRLLSCNLHVAREYFLFHWRRLDKRAFQLIAWGKCTCGVLAIVDSLNNIFVAPLS